jgi:hypothetical protein
VLPAGAAGAAQPLGTTTRPFSQPHLLEVTEKGSNKGRGPKVAEMLHNRPGTPLLRGGQPKRPAMLKAAAVGLAPENCAPEVRAWPVVRMVRHCDDDAVATWWRFWTEYTLRQQGPADRNGPRGLLCFWRTCGGGGCDPPLRGAGIEWGIRDTGKRGYGGTRGYGGRGVRGRGGTGTRNGTGPFPTARYSSG